MKSESFWTVGLIALALLVPRAGHGAELNKTLSLSIDYVGPSELEEPIPGLSGSEDATWKFLTGSAKFSFPMFVTYESMGEHQIPTSGLIRRKHTSFSSSCRLSPMITS